MLLNFLGREMRPHYTDDDGATGGQAGDPPPPAPTPAPDPEPEPTDPAELERLRKALKDANAESAKRRKRLEELEAAEATRAAADLSEAERLKAELDKLKAEKSAADARLRRASLKEAAQDAAQRAGLTFAPGALADAVQLGAFDDLEVDDAGKVAGMADAVKALQKQRPYLFGAAAGAPDINAGARGNGSGAPYITDEERRAAEGRYRHTF